MHEDKITRCLSQNPILLLAVPQGAIVSFGQLLRLVSKPQECPGPRPERRLGGGHEEAVVEARLQTCGGVVMQVDRHQGRQEHPTGRLAGHNFWAQEARPDSIEQKQIHRGIAAIPVQQHLMTERPEVLHHELFVFRPIEPDDNDACIAHHTTIGR